ncbi:MAG: PIN domain-containing protein [Trueperaceae bacterium]|nr:PIN domain-containing protein [Trueperaceae bacterium]
MAYTALLDANVLYPAPIRDVMLELAVTDLFRARWSADIHHEWIEALLRNEPHRDRSALERTRAKMDQATRDALITEYEHLIPSLELPDPDDRHVLAAAIVGRCDVIVTWNARDFPATALDPYGLDVQDPDTFLREQVDLAPNVVCPAIRRIRERLERPPYSVDEYLATLRDQGLVGTAAQLQEFGDLL